MNFKSLVHKNFNFLISEFGFLHHKKGIGYTKNDLELEFYQGKGEVEIVFFVRRDDEIFKPFVSRSFDLDPILRRLRKSEFEPYPSEITGYLTSSNFIGLHLNYYAKLLKQHGVTILNDDLSVFEKIHLMRRENAKQPKRVIPDQPGPPCPKCGELIRTSLSKQCPHCFHDWH